MDDLLGWTALVAVGACTCALAYRWPSIAVPLIVAFGVRALAALFHFYVMPLPDGTADAVKFERFAWEWSQGNFADVFQDFPGINANFYAWLMSLLYAATDRSPLMLQAVSVFVGTLGVFFAWCLTAELWNERDGRKAIWVMALFPTVVQYSALTMREAWVVLFFIFGLIGVLRWARSGRTMPVLGGMAGFLAASFFHGGMFVVGLAFLGVVGFSALKKLILALKRGQFRPPSVFALLLLVIAASVYTSSGTSIPKIGTAAEAVNLQRVVRYIEYQQSLEQAQARYGDWQIPETTQDLLWIVPAKNLYFVFSPFPWDIRVPRHALGFADSFLYIGLAFLAWRHRRTIWHDPGGRAIFLVLVAGVFVFGVGTANFGTAVRHRAKFVVALLALVAPRLPRLVISRTRARDDHGSLDRDAHATSGSLNDVSRSLL